jgi:hypothetical protein
MSEFCSKLEHRRIYFGRVEENIWKRKIIRMKDKSMPLPRYIPHALVRYIRP